MIYEIHRGKDMPQNMGWRNNTSIQDKRIHHRIIVRLKAVLTFKDISYVGMIENISEHGLYMIALPINHGIDFSPGAIHEMKLRTFPGESVIMHCKIQWSYKTPPYGLTNSVDMEVMDPPPEYREFLKTLV
jgi:hypothetical protein